MIPDKEIKRYLDNQMSERERITFERQLKENDDLREEVDFQREMYAFFGQREETNALKEMLNNAAALHVASPPITESKKKPYLYFLWILIAIGLIIGSIFYFSPKTKSNLTDSHIKEEMQDTKIPIESNLSEKEKPIQQDNTSPADEIPPSSPTNSTPSIPSKNNTFDDLLNPTKETDKTNEPDGPIADASIDRFAPSPFLESFIDKNVRANQIVTLTMPAKGQTFTLEDDSILFSLKGETNEEDPILLSVYDNDPDNFDNDHKELSAEILPIEDKEDNYTLSFKAKIPFAKGLYYIVIRNKMTNDILYLNKIYVR